jgi:hypothetical protein
MKVAAAISHSLSLLMSTVAAMATRFARVALQSSAPIMAVHVIVIEQLEHAG